MEWVVVRRCFRLSEALVVRSILEADGLDVLIPDENLLGAEPGAETALGGARVMVRSTDLERARGILSATSQTQELPGDDRS